MQKYIDRCNIYQKIKNCTEVLVGKLIVNEIPEKLWVYLTVDFITKLLLVVEKNMILVVCDRLSKISYFMATVEGTSAEGLTRLFRNNMWKLHRLLKSMISDRELQFAAELTIKLNWILGIKTKLSTSFHLQTDR